MYTDAKYARSVTCRKSTSGYCMFLGGILVTWRSKKQNVDARSGAEVYFLWWHMGCEFLWLRIIQNDLEMT